MSTNKLDEQDCKQEVKITLQLTLWLNANWNDETIKSYATENLLIAFADQNDYYAPERSVDIMDVQQEAEIYGLSE